MSIVSNICLQDALNALTEYWKSEFDVTLRFEFVFSCDIAETPQKFLAGCRSKVPLVFNDMFELHQEYATLTNGEKVKVPQFDMFACGVECDSISRMNKNSVAGQGCIAKGEGRTGRTGQAFLVILKTKRLHHVL